jgi:hypothetical protein
MRRYVNTYLYARTFSRFAKWAEFEAKNVPLALTVFEATFSELKPEGSRQARVFKQFALFEERQGEYEQACVIYKHAITLLKVGSAAASLLAEEQADLTDVSHWFEHIWILPLLP